MLTLPTDEKPRAQSRLSQLLQITEWLNNTNVNNNDVFLFLDTLSKELNRISIGSLIASLLLNNQSIFSNDNINTMLNYCQNTSNYESMKKSNCNTIANISLLSLPNDVLVHCGFFLGKYSGRKFGECCHKLFEITRGLSFLYTSGGHSISLTSRMIQKISDYQCDPWHAFINCNQLELRCGGHVESMHQGSIAMRLLLEKIMNESHYTGWYNRLFRNINKILICENGAGLASFLPIELIFGQEKYNKHRNKIEIVDKKPLELAFHNLWPVNMYDIYPFFENFIKFLLNVDATNNNGGNISNKVRKIGMLTVDSQQSLQELREVANNSAIYFSKPKLCSCYVEMLQPYYLRFQTFDDLWLPSLASFGEIFHNNLIELRARSCLFDFASIINEIYKIVCKKGYTFSLQASILQHSDARHCNDKIKVGRTDLSDIINEKGLAVLQNEDASDVIRRVDGILSDDDVDRDKQVLFQQFYDAVASRMEGYDKPFDDYNDYNEIPLQLLICYTYFMAIQQWLIELIDDNKLGIDIIPIQNQTSLKRVVFKDGNERFYGINMSSKILSKFHDMFVKSIMFRLLNWRYSVEQFNICFVAQIFEHNDNDHDNATSAETVDIDDIIQPTFCAKDAYCLNNNDDSYLSSFEAALNNIFNQKYFAKLKNIDISIQFKTNYQNAQLETVDAYVDNKIQASIDLHPKTGNLNIINNAAAVTGGGDDDKDEKDDNLNYNDSNSEYYYNNNSFGKKIFSIDRFENTIDWYINIFICRIVVNVSKHFQRLKNNGCTISLSIGIGNVTDCPDFVPMKFEETISNSNDNDENNNVNITQWLAQSKESDNYKCVHELLNGYAVRLKQLGRQVKSYVRHKDILEKCFAAPPCVLVVQ